MIRLSARSSALKDRSSIEGGFIRAAKSVCSSDRDTGVGRGLSQVNLRKAGQRVRGRRRTIRPGRHHDEIIDKD